ncbi:peptidase S8/S53 domain-containing protein [Lasiosphaeria miniovina]|uniref:Peptidase S8/S53 domain-containing protein n=1 Tax=Lasiosphaeria miniovina TaxID=1954250 RepID=A0AA40BII8_9PEZI|nr:peptidase S8/S53 domain-containing protein [Lasiosphaeria miniovina]KAK0734866.1 peptidase S8/S53 domain-containing protein [Lasiosphaeria miniovina]
MRFPSVATLLGLASLTAATNILPRNWDSNDYYVLHLDSQTSPAEVARSLGLLHEGPLGKLKDHHIFAARKAEHDIVKRELTSRRRRRRSLGDRSVLDGVLFSQKQELRKPWDKRVVPVQHGPSLRTVHKRTETVDSAAQKKISQVATALDIRDPIFLEQWHLFNSVQVGHDVNVTDVWLQGITGKNATVAIVDDGLDMYSDDLKANYYAAGSYDFNEHTEEPKPRLSDDKHGTRCAGEVSAVKNDVCGVGVAYDSKIAGLRILSKVISDADEAVAMNYDYQHNQIYSCSWGPPDDGRSMDAPGILIRRAMVNAVQNGRGGLGSIYVFASGNGAMSEDNCNFDGYTNSIYSITVGAIDRKGQHPYYSEKCSAGLVVTYSSGAGDAIHTTDVGTNACYSGHGGTSAAAPLAAGIFALVLQVRPDITWRDMQYLAMGTAVPINLDTDEWQTTTIGKKYSHTFGYGKIDSYAIVEASKTWKNVKPQAWYFSPWIHVKEAIPQGDKGIIVSFEVTEDMLKNANFERVEHVTVTMNIEHGRRGDISVDLISPNKIVSHLSTTRKFDDSPDGYDDWTFMSVVHWGESGFGTWTIVVKDTNVNQFSGTFVDWHLKLWGEAKDASKATNLPMPTEEDDDNHADIATTTLPASVTTVVPDPVAADPKITATPSDHPERPVNSKPTESPEVPTLDEQITQPSNSTWLPSFLPTFGVSASTQAWIYGSAVLIVVFCCGLGIYLWMARRKRLRNDERNNYEFELLDEEEAEGLAGNGEKGGLARAKGSRRTRGGELYDAFAGGSDDDEDDDDDFGGATEYRDQAEVSTREKRGVHGDRGMGVAGGDDDEEHHVVGEDDDDDEEDRDDDGEEATPFHSRGSSRR